MPSGNAVPYGRGQYRRGKAAQSDGLAGDFNFFKTPEEKKQSRMFAFAEVGVVEAVAWMNERLTQDHELWENSWSNWTDYKME